MVATLSQIIKLPTANEMQLVIETGDVILHDTKWDCQLISDDLNGTFNVKLG